MRFMFRPPLRHKLKILFLIYNRLLLESFTVNKIEYPK